MLSLSFCTQESKWPIHASSLILLNIVVISRFYKCGQLIPFQTCMKQSIQTPLISLGLLFTLPDASKRRSTSKSESDGSRRMRR